MQTFGGQNKFTDQKSMFRQEFVKETFQMKDVDITQLNQEYKCQHI